jgi:hypothetical protein
MSKSGYSDVPVTPALCFVEAYVPLREKNRRVKGVPLCRPKGLATLVSADGLFDDELPFAIAMKLSTALPSMT